MKIKKEEKENINEIVINYPPRSLFNIIFQCFLIGMNTNQFSFLFFSLCRFGILSICPIIQGKIINAILDKSEISYLDKLAFVFFSLKLSQFILDKFKYALTPGYSEEGLKLKHRFFEKLIRKDTEFFDYEKPANLIKAHNEEFYTFRYFEVSELLDIHLRNFLTFIFTLFSLFYLSKTMFMIELIKVFINNIFSKLSNDDDSKLWEEIDKIDTNRNSIFREVMMNIKLVKTFSSEDKILLELNEIQKKRDALYSAKSKNLHNELSRLSEKLIKAAQLWYAMTLINSGQFSLGDFSAFELIASNLSMSRESIYNYINSLIKESKKVERFLNYMDYNPNITTGMKKKEVHGKIEFKNVDFSYPTKKEVLILKNFNLKINAGEIAAFVGPSGCGKVNLFYFNFFKSTISALIHRLYDVNQGGIMIDGTNIKDMDLENLHSQYGFISQDPMLFTGTIRSNLLFAVDDVPQEKLDHICKLANCYEFIHNLQNGYDSEVLERGSNLSGGQRQRIAIARALLKKIKILILDEATSALDATCENEVQKALEKICHETKITTIIIAHRLSTVKSADRIHVLKNGCIVEQGSHDYLLSLNGDYRRLIEKQLELSN